MARTVYSFNDGWEFSQISDAAGAVTPPHFVPVTLPHTCKEVPLDSFDTDETAGVWCYRKKLLWQEDFAGKEVTLCFDGVMTRAEVSVNSKTVAEHNGGFTPFEVEIGDCLLKDSVNIIEVVVDSRELSDVPPFGGVLDYLTFGGIYRDVYLRVTEHENIRFAFVKGENLLTDLPTVCTSVKISDSSKNGYLRLRLEAPDGYTVSEVMRELEADETEYEFRMTFGVGDLMLWSCDSPVLYKMNIELHTDHGHKDSICVRTGLREAVFTENGFYLNGEKVKLVGANRHQAYPYVGYAMPERQQKRDADILKYRLGLNIVRTSHYPQSPHFLERCDEIGLMVLEEIPGWHHIGDETWKESAENTLKEMILRDRNHPSVILWGVRVNESLDDRDFYLRTNALAHELDSTRQTGGVRAIENSEFLEDVFTFNDFIYDGTGCALRQQQLVTGLDKNVPYLVTEFCGHTYPAKRYDCEERLIEHALRHATVQNASALDDTSCGAIFWCAFDYNTHCEFGSGNMTCYHGVCDAFRIPKYAAWFYESQLPLECRGVLHVASVVSMGERSGSGLCPLVVFTNHEKIRIYSGDELIGEYLPDYENFKGLKHPPIIAREGMNFLWGGVWQGLRVEAYDGDVLAQQQSFLRNPYPTGLTAVSDDDVIFADGSDVTRVVFTLTDSIGNPVVYNSEILSVKVNGEATLIGPTLLPMLGGSTACFVRAGKTAGEFTVSGKLISSFSASVTVKLQKKEENSL